MLLKLLFLDNSAVTASVYVVVGFFVLFCGKGMESEATKLARQKQNLGKPAQLMYPDPFRSLSLSLKRKKLAGLYIRVTTTAMVLKVP